MSNPIDKTKLLTLSQMKVVIRGLLAANPELETESEKRTLIRNSSPFTPSELRYSDWKNAGASVLNEKPSKKLLRPAESFPDDSTREWARKNNLIQGGKDQ